MTSEAAAGAPPAAPVDVLLEPGDLLLLRGEARYGWAHGIAARMEDAWAGRRIVRGKRVSVTLRRMAEDCTLAEHGEE